jgi:hypothetical protein
MPHCQIIVIKSKGRWMLRSELLGAERHFPAKAAALKNAIDLAQQSGRDGRRAKVVVCDSKRAAPAVVWTYGQDTYPPSISLPDELAPEPVR